MKKEINVSKETSTAGSEIGGDEFKPLVLRWTALANFAVRVGEHLNRFALTASSDGKMANTVRLVRYVKKYDPLKGPPASRLQK